MTPVAKQSCAGRVLAIEAQSRQTVTHSNKEDAMDPKPAELQAETENLSCDNDERKKDYGDPTVTVVRVDPPPPPYDPPHGGGHKKH